jgi:hypothetical protein
MTNARDLIAEQVWRAGNDKSLFDITWTDYPSYLKSGYLATADKILALLEPASDQVAEIRARLDAASPGPWSAPDLLQPPGRSLVMKPIDPSSDYANIPGLSNGRDVLGAVSCANHEADARFIAHARQDIPTLLDMLTSVTDTRADDAINYLNQCGILRIEPSKNTIRDLLEGKPKRTGRPVAPTTKED